MFIFHGTLDVCYWSFIVIAPLFVLRCVYVCDVCIKRYGVRKAVMFLLSQS